MEGEGVGVSGRAEERSSLVCAGGAVEEDRGCGQTCVPVRWTWFGIPCFYLMIEWCLF